MEGVKIKSRQREIAAQANSYNYTQNLDCFQFVAEQITKINYKLLELRDDLQSIQPQIEGSITLTFNNCGMGSHKLCGGCPHPVFKKWTKTKLKKTSTKKEGNVSIVKNPKHSLLKTGAFEDCYLESKSKIDEINKLVDERGRLLKLVGALKKSSKYTSAEASHSLPTINRDLREGEDKQRGIAKQSIEYNYELNLIIFQFITDHISSINSKLFDMREELRVIQPKLDGSISLLFNNCSKEDHKLCGGCPHPVFVKWVNPQLRKARSKIDWAPSISKNPKKDLKKTGVFEERYDESRLKIDEINSLISERSRILKLVGSLKKAVHYTSDLPDPSES
tara:strand:+ start:4354 stop:5361 length:1008 start_codon:yes stop_codon:yes gene_type:complete